MTTDNKASRRIRYRVEWFNGLNRKCQTWFDSWVDAQEEVGRRSVREQAAIYYEHEEVAA